MEKKYTALIIALSIVLIILITVFMFFRFGWSVDSVQKLIPAKGEKTVTGDPASTSPSVKPVKTISGKPTEELNTQTNAAAPKQISKDDLMRIASSFAERFGSYSNQSNFNNITDLKIFMTGNMVIWADKYLNEQRAKNADASIYYGITTKSVSQEVKEYDDDMGKASILVKTRRREAISSTSNTTKVFDQNIMINFVKENGAWKVDSANWQNK